MHARDLRGRRVLDRRQWSSRADSRVGEVAHAQGIARVAKLSGLGRESLYKALRPSSHPRLETILRVAQALGIRLHVSAA